ncbi:MAG: ATP-binding protein [Acidobacteriaceae bacterium]
MDPVQNPFAPGAGTQPPELAGRDSILNVASTMLRRIRAGRPSRSLILVGLRGVGKTVLLNRIRELAEEAAYQCILIEAHEEKSLPSLLVPPLRRILLQLDRAANISEKTKRGLRVLRSFMSRFQARLKLADVGEIELGVAAEQGVADTGDLEVDLTDLFVAVAEAAADRHQYVCLLVDEIQYFAQSEMSALIIALHQVSQRALPLVLVGAGLPLILGLAGRSKSYAERLFEFPGVGPLKETEARRALQSPVQAQGVMFTDEALRRIIGRTQGYPYFLQQWGYEAWNIAASSPITEDNVAEATSVAIQKLDESFFRVRFDRLTRREKEYLSAMVSVGGDQQRSGDIAEALGVKVQSVAPLRSSLIRKGMIYSPSHGDTSFTVPLFDGFLKRQQSQPGGETYNPRLPLF